MLQRTIAKSVEIKGIGLHKGVPIKLRLEPLDDDMGIVFYREDESVSIGLKPQNVVDTKMATVIGKDGVVISTIEHLLSAIYAYGIDNLRVVVDNDEVPILDGSSQGYCELIESAGIKTLSKSKKAIVIKKDILVEDSDKFVKLSKSNDSNSINYDFSIAFSHPVINRQNYSFEFTLENYKKEIASARTFGFLRDVQYLRSIGLAKGGSLDNAIVLDDNRVLNQDGLRFENEFVRHKILDAIGDISLLGYMVIGYYSAHAGSHHLNHLLTKKLLESKESYEVVELTKSVEKEYKYSFARVKL
jgi:UDP-3-O-[3-hydroxymyristoyl] N-acetylglucosamine deacetylase